MNPKTTLLAFTLLAAACGPLMNIAPAYAHCEIPCGIYGDRMRIDMIAEDITTVEKSMKQITALSGQQDKNFNQIVRWVENKEVHADRIAHTVTQYFMTQRVKPVPPDQKQEHDLYLIKITILHKMLIQSLKAKQTTDLKHVQALRKLLETFDKAYFKPGHK